ncbi:MAG: PxKF domain-containing protein [Candidatus Nitrosocaldus sp.]
MLSVLVMAAIVLGSIGSLTMQVGADSAMIWTDKEDYSPGEVVTIYGSGFLQNAQITITVVQPNGTVDSIIVDASDADGNFIAYYTIDNDDPVGTYTVTATDGTNTASTTFTDAPKVGSVSISPSSRTVTAGGSTTYTVTVNRGSGPGSSGSFTADLSIVGTLPNGVTATFNPNPVGFNPTDTSKSSTLTIQTSTTTPAGTYTFKVRAETAAHDFAISNDITLIVEASDTTPPVITPNISGTLGNNGWYTSDVTVSWDVNDPESGIVSTDGCDTAIINYDTTGVTLTCTATNGAGLNSSVSVTIKRDATPPTLTKTLSGTSGNNGWYVSDVEVTLTGSDATSGLASIEYSFDGTNWTNYSGPFTITAEGTTTLYHRATDNAGNTYVLPSQQIKIDKTAPTVTATPDRSADHNGWYNAPLTITFSGTDATSGIDSCDSPVNYNGPDGTNIEVTGSCTDNAGNVGSASYTFDYDNTDPTVFILGISNGQQFDFGDPLPSVECDATDNLSGIQSCTITPSTLPTSVGSHTITATAKDNAGNTATTSITYTILGWTIQGFKPPVDNPPVINVVKNGSTVPLKFEVFKTLDGVELTDTSIVKQPLKAQKMNCTTLNDSPTDEIELTATGGTSLRYDWTEGQFIYNWKTPTQKDTCWKVTIEFQDGSSIYAYFRLR